MSRSSALGQFPNLPVLADGADITELGTTMADQIEKYVNMRFATAVARDAVVTVPEAGMRAYLTTPKVWTEYDGTAWRGEWVTTFDPVITQGGGAIAHTVGVSEYRYDGPMIDWTFTINMTGAGTASSISVTLPVTAYNADSQIREPVGGGLLFDASTAVRLEVHFETTMPAGTAMTTNTTGLPILANGDIWRIGIRYRWV